MVVYDVCVVGAGVNGSSAAYVLAKQGKNVLLLEQFPTPHTRGSSHGQSRIIRCLAHGYIYGKIALDSISLWRTLENETGKQLLLQNGMLEIFDKEKEPHFHQGLQVLQKLGVGYEFLSANEITKRFPAFNVSDDCKGLYESVGGMLLASKCVASLQEMFVRNGGKFHDGETVLSMVPGKIVKITTSKGQYQAKSVIITAGPFASKLTKQLGLNLPLKVQRTHACYWKAKNPDHVSALEGFPSFIGPMHTYGLAAFEYPGLVKICSHHGPEVDIDKPHVTPDITEVSAFVKKYTNGVELKPSVVEACHYTVTPDRNFIIDTHPVHKNIVIGAGFSGSGFKMAPVTGKILADLALGRKPQYDLTEFQIDRFPNVLESISAKL